MENTFLQQVRLFLSVCLAVCVFLIGSISSQKALSNADIINFVKEKLSATVIESIIRNSTSKFDTSTPALARLTKAGVPDSVIALMIEQVRNPAPLSEHSKANPASGDANSIVRLGPRKPGIARIGIVTTQAVVPMEQDEAVRAQLYELLYGNRTTSTSEAVLLREKLDRNIVSESLMTKCDYLLFINLDSTIHSAADKRGNFIEKAIKSGSQALGAVSKLPTPLSAYAGITYRTYQMADSLTTSTDLLGIVTQATKKKDRIGVNFRLVHVATRKEIIAPTLKEIVAKKDKEPIFQNLLIQIGNQIIDSVVANGGRLRL